MNGLLIDTQRQSNMAFRNSKPAFGSMIFPAISLHMPPFVLKIYQPATFHTTKGSNHRNTKKMVAIPISSPRKVPCHSTIPQYRLFIYSTYVSNLKKNQRWSDNLIPQHCWNEFYPFLSFSILTWGFTWFFFIFFYTSWHWKHLKTISMPFPHGPHGTLLADVLVDGNGAGCGSFVPMAVRRAIEGGEGDLHRWSQQNHRG